MFINVQKTKAQPSSGVPIAMDNNSTTAGFKKTYLSLLFGQLQTSAPKNLFRSDKNLAARAEDTFN